MDWITTLILGIVAAALVVQCVAFLGIQRAIRNISIRVDGLSGEIQDKLGTVSANVNDLLTTIRPTIEKIHVMQHNLTATSEIIHRRVEDFDALAQDFTAIAREQLVRVQNVAETTALKIEETATFLQQGVLTPVNEIAAILRGVRAALSFLFRQRGLSTHQHHQDEEMFI
jgi:transcriptional regulator